MLGLRLISLACVAFLIGATTATAEVVRGQSRELGIRFEVAGGEDWCKPDPVVRLDADTRSSFKPEGVPFQQMIGRIRAVMAGQCGIVEHIGIEGRVKGQLVLVAETSRRTGWRHLVVRDAATRRPHCLGGQQGHLECTKRAQAYIVAEQALRSELYPDLELTTLLDPRAPTHLGWRAGGVIGKLTIAEADHLSDFYETSGPLAEAFIADTVESCNAGGGQAEEQWQLEAGKEITIGGLVCQRKTAAETTVVVVAATAAGFDIFGLWSDKADAESVKLMGWGIALAVKERGW